MNCPYKAGGEEEAEDDKEEEIKEEIKRIETLQIQQIIGLIIGS